MHQHASTPHRLIPTLALVMAVALLLAGGAFAAEDPPAVEAPLNPFVMHDAPRVAQQHGFNGDPAYSGGPNVCADCHSKAFDDWVAHGHSRKLALTHPLSYTETGDRGTVSSALEGGFPLPVHNDEVYDWDNVLFIIGASKHWKTRYVGLDGYILTDGGKNQYNWRNGKFSNYHADEQRPFSCGPCHTSGYRSPDEGGDFFQTQLNMPGIVGDFAHINITCEACHGPGYEHTQAPSSSNIVVDDSAAACGQCHTRGSDPNVVLASGGFIRHHEQWPELLKGAHGMLDCDSCHEPHKTRALGMKLLPGASEVCATCHSDKVDEYADSAMELAGVTCQDCHMAKATKSAVAAGPYEGDVWTHLFAIDSSADYDMFERDDDGATIAAKGAINLEFACLRCHADADQASYAAIGDGGAAYHTLGKVALS